MDVTPDEIRSCVERGFLGNFSENRVKSLLAYGSMIDGRSTNSDVDVYLLLNSWDKSDVIAAKQSTEAIDAPVDLTLHYHDELPGNPNNFRLGKKSCLALAYLASAEVIHGENIPAAMFEELDHKAIQSSALHAVFYYLGQMRKELSTLDDNHTVDRHMNKYMARSIIDAMMFYKKITYEPFKALSPSDVVSMAREHPQIGRIFSEVEEVETNTGKLEFMHRLHGQLRLANWIIGREEEMKQPEASA